MEALDLKNIKEGKLWEINCKLAKWSTNITYTILVN